MKAGTVKGLALLANQRMSDAPNVPTMNESGVNELNVDSWIGLFAPTGTPKPVIEKLQKEIAAAAPELKTKFVAVGGDYLEVPPDKLDAFVHAEFVKWSKVIREAGISLE